MKKTTYDPVADAMYIRIWDIAPRGVTTRRIEPGVSIDYIGEMPIGVEILNVSTRVTPAELKKYMKLPTGDVDLTIAEAVNESGLAAQTLRAQISNGRLQAKKRGRDWLISRTALLNYLESRDTRGRPAKATRARRKNSAA